MAVVVLLHYNEYRVHLHPHRFLETIIYSFKQLTSIDINIMV